MNASDSDLRPIEPRDEEAVAEVAITAWTLIRAARRAIVGDELHEAQRTDWQEGFREWSRRNVVSGEAFVSEMGGRVVGFAGYSVQTEPSRGGVGYNAVLPEFRRMGIGSRQCRAIVDLFRERHLAYARVGTGRDPVHAGARAQYRKCGFNKGIPRAQFFGYLREAKRFPCPAQVQIRALEPADADASVELFRSAVAPARAWRRSLFGDIICEGEFPSFPDAENEALRRALARDDSDCLVACAAGEVLGFCQILVPEDNPIGEVRVLAVHPEAQGKGIGKAMLSAALDSLAARGCAYAQCNCDTGPHEQSLEHVLQQVGLDRVIPSIVYYQSL